MAQKVGIKKPQICQAGSAVTFEDSCTTGAEHSKIFFILPLRSSPFFKNIFLKVDHPSDKSPRGSYHWGGTFKFLFYVLF
jgi:hypothetical protein